MGAEPLVDQRLEASGGEAEDLRRAEGELATLLGPILVKRDRQRPTIGVARRDREEQQSGWCAARDSLAEP